MFTKPSKIKSLVLIKVTIFHRSEKEKKKDHREMKFDIVLRRKVSPASFAPRRLRNVLNYLEGIFLSRLAHNSLVFSRLTFI